MRLRTLLQRGGRLAQPALLMNFKGIPAIGCAGGWPKSSRRFWTARNLPGCLRLYSEVEESCTPSSSPVQLQQPKPASRGGASSPPLPLAPPFSIPPRPLRHAPPPPTPSSVSCRSRQVCVWGGGETARVRSDTYRMPLHRSPARLAFTVDSHLCCSFHRRALWQV